MVDDKKNLDRFNIADRFETEEYLGSGSTGIVYKARDLSNNNIVAIKALKTELSKNDKFINSLTTELKDILKLDHKNIIKFYEIISYKEKYFIIMEYVVGMSLEDLLKKQSSFEINFSLNIIMQVAEALNYAGSKNIYHKALKPQNLIITPDNEVKLTDFGFAKAIATAWLTLTGTSPTQVEYMSPEQAEGENIDQRTDIYSLGIIAYQMLTGDVPFKREGTSILSVAMKHINEKAQPLSLKNPAIPNWLENTILKCLEKTPENRFQNGQELFIALKETDQTSKKQIKNVVAINDELNFIDENEMNINDQELLRALSDGYTPEISSEAPPTLIINNFEQQLESYLSETNSKSTEIIFTKRTQKLDNDSYQQDDMTVTYEDLQKIIGNNNDIVEEVKEEIKTVEKSNVGKIMLFLFLFLIVLTGILIFYIAGNS